MATLVIAEHDNAELKAATLNTLGAAKEIGGEVHVLVAGSGCGSVADAAAAFGRGRVVSYSPSGAVEVRSAESHRPSSAAAAARRRKPGVITQLSLAGSEALNRYVDAYERIGGASATEFDVSVDGGKVGDGGVLHRTQLAAELRRCEALISGYRVQHPSGRSSNTRAEIEALHVLKMVGAGWIKPKQILRDHRWGINKQNLFRVNQTFGWTILRLKIAFGIEDFKRVFDSPPGFLVQYRTTEIPDER